MKVGGLQKFTLIDYPGKIACIVFSMGCNFRCPYCHNRELVEKTTDEIPWEEIFEFLEERKGQLEGVEITGGEPTIHSGLTEFLERVKEMGYSTKLDTNGSIPDMLKELIDRDLVDYLAMDLKASIPNYSKAAGVEVDPEKIKESVETVKDFEEHEFRTTAVPGIIDVEEVRKIGETIQGADNYFIQQFRPKNTLKESYTEKEVHPEEKLERMKEAARQFVENCEIRNI